MAYENDIFWGVIAKLYQNSNVGDYSRLELFCESLPLEILTELSRASYYPKTSTPVYNNHIARGNGSDNIPPDYMRAFTDLEITQDIGKTCYQVVKNVTLQRKSALEEKSNRSLYDNGGNTTALRTAALFSEYARPTGGWFLARRWGTHENNIKASLKIVEGLNHLASEGKEDNIEAIRDVIYGVTKDLHLDNPYGLFARRHYAAMKFLREEQHPNQHKGASPRGYSSTSN